MPHKIDMFNCRSNNYKYIDDIFSSLSMGVLLIDEGGIIRYANNIWNVKTGLDVLSCVNKKYDDIFPWLEFKDILNKNNKIQYYKLNKEGNYFIECRALLNNKLVTGVICILHYQERCKSFCSLIEEYKHLDEEMNSILDSSYDCIWVSNEEGVTIRVNSAYERITGIKVKEVIGRKPKEMIKDGLYTSTVIDPVIEKKERMTIVNTTASGKKILVTATPILDENGNIRRVVTNIRDVSELTSLQKEIEMLTKKHEIELSILKGQDQDCKIVAHSKGMQEIIELVCRVSCVDSSIFITGESGVGKEVIARLIHRLSNRQEGPFIVINCGAIPESLIESELFGYEKGSFTGSSYSGKLGLFEIANRGTLFLDEIAELNMNMQVKLLRAIQERSVMRVGGTKPIKLDIRIIAATNKKVEEMIKQEKFREDLYYRINVIPINIPPLRTRKEEIPLLVKNILGEYNEKYKTNKSVTVKALDRLIEYDWPGNIRELSNIIERLAILTNSDEITYEDLPSYLRNNNNNNEKEINYSNGEKLIENIINNNISNIPDVLCWIEHKLLEIALDKGKTTRKAAKILGVNQSTVVRKMRKYREK